MYTYSGACKNEPVGSRERGLCRCCSILLNPILGRMGLYIQLPLDTYTGTQIGREMMLFPRQRV